MSDLRDIFLEELNHSESGMLGRIEHFQQVLRRSDPELSSHLEDKGIPPLFYAARWIGSMLAQDLEMPDVMRAWDALLGHVAGPEPLLHHLCVARLVLVRKPLLAGDEADCEEALRRGGFPDLEVAEA